MLYRSALHMHHPAASLGIGLPPSLVLKDCDMMLRMRSKHAQHEWGPSMKRWPQEFIYNFMEFLYWAPSSLWPTSQSSGPKTGVLVSPLFWVVLTILPASGTNQQRTKREKKSMSIFSHTLGNHSFTGTSPQSLRCLPGHQTHCCTDTSRTSLGAESGDNGKKG